MHTLTQLADLESGVHMLYLSTQNEAPRGPVVVPAYGDRTSNLDTFVDLC
jgi:hypothetical protein